MPTNSYDKKYTRTENYNLDILEKYCFYLTASNASPMASSDQGVGFERDSSMPSRLHRPYNVPETYMFASKY